MWAVYEHFGLNLYPEYSGLKAQPLNKEMVRIDCLSTTVLITFLCLWCMGWVKLHLLSWKTFQATGNLLVSSQTSLCLFQLVTRTHDISRQRFLDFELWPVTLELSFAPVYLAIVEDVVAAMDSDSLHVFRINKGLYFNNVLTIIM